MDGFTAGQAHHRFPGSFLVIVKTPFNKKVLVPRREQGQKDNFCGTTLLAGNSGHSVTVPTHRLPVNAGIASEDTLGDPISPCPQRPIYCLAYRSALSSRNSLWMRFAVLLPPQWFL